MMKKILLITLAAVLSFSQLRAQGESDTLISITEFSLSYGYHLPGGDLADRFGPASTIGGSFSYKTNANWKFGIHGNFLFGNTVREDNHMALIETADGYILDQGGIFATMNTAERGGIFSLSVGKIIPTNNYRPNSGLLLQIAPGYTFHKILIETEENNSPQIMDDYVKGYDRFSAGFHLEQFIGFVHYDDNNLYNFYGGFEFRQGLSQNKRAYDFDLMSVDNSTKLDLMFGIKIGWIVPIKKRENTDREIIFYN